MNFQDAAALTTPNGGVRNIHNKNSDLLWSAVGYNVRYDGDSTQQTYTGKNKIRLAPLTTTASGINWVVTKDTISASGTASSNWSIPRGFVAFATPLPAGSYVFSIPSAIDKAFQLNMRDSNDTTYDYTIQAGNTYVSFTTSYEAKSFRFALKAGQGVETNVTMENKLQLEAGSTATAYEPYVGGSPSPNPDYPQDVNVVTGEQTVNITGKNLFSGYTKGIRINPTTGGVETNSTAASSDFIPLDLTGSNKAIFSGLPNTLYSLVAAYNSEKVFLGRTSAGSVGSRLLGSDSFTSGTPQGSGDVVFIRLSVYENSSAQGVIGDIDDANIQLELGDTATAYEPYQSQSYTVSLGSVELCKIGDYQDYIYKSSGKNLFDGVLEVGIINGITGLDQANNNYVRAEDYIPVEELTYYRISTDNANISSVFVYEYKADKTYNLTANKSLTLTDVYRTEEDTAFIRFRPNYQTTDTSIKFQVEKGTVVTPYEPYGTDWYVYEKMGKLVFNGSENWTISNSGTVNFYYSLNNLNLGFTQNSLDLVSNYGSPGEVGNTNTEQGIIIVPSGSNNRLRIRYGTEMTVANWQSKLSTTNMVLYYVLKTSTYTKITDNILIGQLNAIHDWLTRYDYYGTATGNLPIIINRTGLT